MFNKKKGKKVCRVTVAKDLKNQTSIKDFLVFHIPVVTDSCTASRTQLDYVLPNYIDQH